MLLGSRLFAARNTRVLRQTLGMSTRASAGIIVIGDEILKGQTVDTNSAFLASNLHNYGIQLKRVVVIPDDIDVIAREVKQFSETYNYVLTSGGVGPTHDDLTYEGVAKAFDDEIFINPELKQLLVEYFKGNINEATLKLVQIPKSSKLIYSSKPVKPGRISYPLVSVGNVYIFPGIPALLRRAFHLLADDLFGSHAALRTHVQECFVTLTELEIASSLNRLVDTYRDKVTFGSYPKWVHAYYRTKITVEADTPDLAKRVAAEIKSIMPTINYDKDPASNAMCKINALLESSQDDHFKSQLKEAMDTISQCYVKYKPHEVAVAFNGGKDCIAMLHLVHAHLKMHHPEHKEKLQALYVHDNHSFAEVEEFIRDSSKLYDLDLVAINAPMKQALEKMLSDNPQVKAMVMGTRKGDPGSRNQSQFSPTDGNWPKVMRVNPVLHWEYRHVWTFLRGLYLPYPGLYDRGYTSLGTEKNTEPNPNLAFQDDHGKIKYRPAYELDNGLLERAGRDGNSRL